MDSSLSGSGCDFEHVSASFSPEGQDLSLLFDNYIAEVGSQTSEPHLIQKIKECQIKLKVQLPQGWQMAFKAVDYRGFALLPQAGASAFHRFIIQQEGAPIVSLQEAQLVGPLNQDYFKRMTVRPERLTWSRCLKNETMITIGSQLGVRLNPRSPVKVDLASIMLDSSDISLQQTLSVEWKKCPESHPEIRPIRPISPRPPRYRGR
ncbi:MAG: DUF4360 domain-containing protein [Bdellovibrionales bacterium]